MSIQFDVLDDVETVVIKVEGQVDTEQVTRMRQRTVELMNETGYKNYLVDVRGLQSLDQGRKSSILEMGYNFSESSFSVWCNTAVLMPDDKGARDQVELLHTVELNRGRGTLKYVHSKYEAYGWFEEMSERVKSGPTRESIR